MNDNKILRNKLSILFLVVLIVPFLSIITFNIIKNIEIDNYYNFKINSGSLGTELIEMTFSRQQVDNEINWFSNREFILADCIYKIVKVKYTGNDIIYYCWRDTKKTELNKNINDLYIKLSGNIPVNKSTSETVTKFFQLMFSLPENICLVLAIKVLPEKHFEFDSRLPENITVNIEKPPKILSYSI